MELGILYNLWKYLNMAWINFNSTDNKASTSSGASYDFCMAQWARDISAESANARVDMTTEMYDTWGDMTISWWQVTLTEGTYIVNWMYRAYDSAQDHWILYNTSDSTAEIYWSEGTSDTSDSSVASSMILGQIDVASWGKTYEMRSWLWRVVRAWATWTGDFLQFIKIA